MTKIFVPTLVVMARVMEACRAEGIPECIDPWSRDTVAPVVLTCTVRRDPSYEAERRCPGVSRIR